jgi:hypothetical protein
MTIVAGLIILYFVTGVFTAYVHRRFDGHDWLCDWIVITLTWPVFWFAWIQWWFSDSRDD